MRKELENRLISLSVNIDKLCKGLAKGFMSEHLTRQVIRSSTSAALNYGEAQRTGCHFSQNRNDREIQIRPAKMNQNQIEKSKNRKQNRNIEILNRQSTTDNRQSRNF